MNWLGLGFSVEYALVFFLTALVGLAELLARYRDHPVATLKTLSAWFYVLFNGAVGCAALYVLDAFPNLLGEVSNAADAGAAPAADGVTPAADGAGQENPAPSDDGNGPAGWTDEQLAIMRVFAASFGSLAIMRSAFARMAIGGQEVGFGPSALIEVFQRTADRNVDRKRAVARISQLPDDLAKIPFDIASTALVEFGVGSMQNLSSDERERIKERIATITNVNLPDEIGEIRTLLTGLMMQEYIGAEVLSQIVKKIKEKYGSALSEQVSARTSKADDVDAALK